MKLKLLPIFLALLLASPWTASAISIKPTITWDDTTDVIPPPIGTGFSSSTAYGQAPGDPREQAGFTGTFFSTVDVTPFSGANVWLVEPGSTTLSDWIGIDSLTRTQNGGGWDYTIDMRFVSDSTDETPGFIPDPPSSPPWDTYPFVTETGTLQDITGAFRVNGPFPGYTAPAGLTDLIQISVASDANEAVPPGDDHATPDGGSSLLLLGLTFSGVGLIKQRVKKTAI